MASFGIRRELSADYDQVLARLPEVLKSEGFGVLTEIDVKNTLKEKLGVDFRRYKILGACNPPLAHEALQQELDVGLMMPCNVVVYENDDGSTSVVAVDPTQTLAAQGRVALQPLAEKVRDKLSAALARLA